MFVFECSIHTELVVGAQVFPALQQGGSVHLGSLHEVWSLNKGDPVDVVGMACITPGETYVLLLVVHSRMA